MLRKKYLLLPFANIFFPYILIGLLSILFFADRIAIFDWIMTYLFFESALTMILVLMISLLLAFVCNIVYIIIALNRKEDFLLQAKIGVIVKIIEIPSYLLFFITGIIFFITIFTIGFSVLFIIIDVFTLILSASLIIVAAVNAYRDKKTTLRIALCTIFLQFIYCVDVIISIIFYLSLRSGYLNAKDENI